MARLSKKPNCLAKGCIAFFLFLILYTVYVNFHKQSSDVRSIKVFLKHDSSSLLEHIRPPGVLVIAGGGLGNQLFNYASSLAVSKKFNLPLYISKDDKDDKGVRNSSLYLTSARGFMLDFFNLPEGTWVTKNSWKSQDIHKYNCEELLYNNIQPKAAQSKLLLNSDYCHSEKYFENVTQEIKQYLRPVLHTESESFNYWRGLILPNNSETDRMSVAIHIRRGDYGNRQYWTTPISYFRSAMRLILQKFDKKKVVFFVFSDDMNYVNENLLKLEEGEDEVKVSKDDIHFVSGAHGTATNLEEFILMSMCRSMIISNSTFSWWSAYLMTLIEDTVIIAPKFHPKFLDHVKDKHSRDFKVHMWKFKYPLKWIQLDPYNGTGL